MKTIKYKGFDISVKKYSFFDTYKIWSYYIFTIFNSDDLYHMVFAVNGLTEKEALQRCERRLAYKNKCSLKITTNDNIFNFIDKYKEEIDKFNKDYDVEIRKV